MSDRITELAGWQPADVIGERIQEFDEAIPSAEELWSETTSNMPDGQVMTFDGRFRRADGATVTIEVRMTMMSEGPNRLLVAAARDVESRVRVEARLRDRETTLTAAIGALVDGVVAVDQAGIVTLANPRAAELAGIPLHQILGRPLLDTNESPDHHVWPLAVADSPLLNTLATGTPVTGLIQEITTPVTRWLLVNTASIVDPLTGEGQGAVSTSADITDLIEARAELEDMASMDALTGLPNRGHFQRRLEAALANSSDPGDHVALLFLDVDGFKTVNDSLGHSHGDELLQLAGVRLAEQLRPNDFIARIGGDEFVVLLPHLGPTMVDAERDACDVAERIVTRMSDPFDLTSRTVRISASVGIALTPPSTTDAEGLLRQADLAMYAAKESGRGAFRVFDQQMDAEAHRAMLLDGELRQAVERGELAIYLQPRINVATGQLSGAEALLRWP
ncbi:MAG: diguanylate cyclase, partial [Aquihabitans sp.]